MRLRPSSISRALLTGALTLTTVLTASPLATAITSPTGCFDSTVAGTVEEQRLDNGIAGGASVPAEILARSGFDRQVALFSRVLCGAGSQAAAQALNGQTYEIQTVVFPVRYTDFDENMVENALSPHYRPGPQHADLVMTASQGRVGIFDLEVYNGRRRSVSSIGDNNNLWGGGTINAPVVSPSMPPGPEWLTTSLPAARMAQTDVTPFRTRVNTSVLEIPAGETLPVRRPLGPTPGSIASEGAGGGYLSNEVAYRNTLQRDLLDPLMPAGHLHVPVLQFDTANKTAITDPTYEANRNAIITGAHAILRSAFH